jgi:hypothetical protein
MGYEVKITSRANRDLIDFLEYIESRENDSGLAIQFTNKRIRDRSTIARAYEK